MINMIYHVDLFGIVDAKFEVNKIFIVTYVSYKGFPINTYSTNMVVTNPSPP